MTETQGVANKAVNHPLPARRRMVIHHRALFIMIIASTTKLHIGIITPFGKICIPQHLIQTEHHCCHHPSAIQHAGWAIRGIGLAHAALLIFFFCLRHARFRCVCEFEHAV